MEELSIRSLIDVHRLQRIQDRFAEATGFAMITVDCKGVPVTAASSFTAFCTVMRADADRRRECFKCDAHGGLQSAIDGRPYIYRCHSGLVDFSVPIMLGDQYLGAILCGQVRLAEGQDRLDFVTTEDDRWRLDAELNAMFDEIQIADVAKLNSVADTLYEMASYLVEKEYLNSVRSALQERELLFARQSSAPPPVVEALLAQGDPDASGATPVGIVGRSTGQAAPPSPFDFSPLERACLDEDLVEALRVVNLFLDIAFQGSGKFVGRLRLAEIEDQIVRLAEGASAQIGWDLHQRVLRHRSHQNAHLSRYHWRTYIEGLLFSLHNGITGQRPRRPRTMSDLLNYIEQHAGSALALSKAAEYLSVSPSHLSKTFKARTGVRFVDYVAEKRIERAKLMLAHTDLPVLRIATDLSFQPVNYFSRVFKKHTAMTPSDYRRWCTTPDAQENTA